MSDNKVRTGESRWDVFSKALNNFVTAITVRTMMTMRMVVLVMSLCLPCRCRSCRGRCWCCRTGYTHIEHREESLWIQTHNDHTVDLQNPPDTHTDLQAHTGTYSRHTHTQWELYFTLFIVFPWCHAPRDRSLLPSGQKWLKTLVWNQFCFVKMPESCCAVGGAHRLCFYWTPSEIENLERRLWICAVRCTQQWQPSKYSRTCRECCIKVKLKWK